MMRCCLLRVSIPFYLHFEYASSPKTQEITSAQHLRLRFSSWQWEGGWRGEQQVSGAVLQWPDMWQEGDIIGSWLRLEGVFEDQLAPIPLPWAGTSLSTSGCPGPHSTRPWTPPGTGHLHIHDFSFWYILELNAAHPSSWSGIDLCSLLHNGSFDVLGVLRRLHNWLKDLSLLQMSNKWCFLFLFFSSYYVLVLQA